MPRRRTNQKKQRNHKAKQRQRKHDKLNKNKRKPTKKPKKQMIYKRVTQMQQMYTEWQKNENKQCTIFELICNYYQSNTINQFYNDYDYVINNIDNHKMYISNQNNCQISNCIHLSRNYRKCADLSKNNKERVLMYDGIENENEIVIIQHLDIIHNILYHLIHSGLRSDVTNNQNHRAAFDKIRRQNQKNKFVTYFDSEQKETHNLPCYATGMRYYYHKRYRNMHTLREKIPLSGNLFTDVVDQGNCDYSSKPISEWFIIPKYQNLKLEILSNHRVSFSIEQWQNTVIKSELKRKRYKNKVNKAFFLWQKAYGFGGQNTIDDRHIQALFLYTNYSDLCTKFTETYRKLSENESDSHLKDRHSYFAHFGKALKECVEVFGVRKSKHTHFYHGINRKMVFKKLCERFCGPTSPSIFKEVASNFGGEGIMLTIQNNSDIVSYFPCISFSDFPAEAEMLYISGLERLSITNITDLAISKSYEQYI
eukprot:37477_1